MKLNIKIVLIASFILQVSLLGQSSSSYSSIGIGDILYSYSAYGLSIGQLGVSLSDPGSIEMLNPASWNQINKTRFNVFMNYSGLFLSDNSAKDFNGKAQFGGFTLAFPLSDSNGIAAAFGIVPYSRISYNVSGIETDLQEGGSSSLLFQGIGGLSKIFIGSSYRLPFGLCIGASYNYYFGNLNYTATSQFINSAATNATYTWSYNPEGMGANFGLISPDLSGIFNSSFISNLKIGFAAEYIAPLNTDTLSTYTSTVGTDTVAEAEVQMKIPIRLSAGLSFALSQKYFLNFDFSSQAWSQYSFNGIKSDELRNSLKLSAGFQYMPMAQLNSTSWQQTIWRAGVSYEQTQYKIDGTGINQFSLSGGLSYPMSQSSTLDFAIQYAVRGTVQSNLIKENIIKVIFGLSFGELWFLRPVEP